MVAVDDRKGLSVQLAQGVTVAGSFRLVHELGRGAMGAVWRAHHTRLNVPCAVKFILGEAAEAPGPRARFEQEAQAAALLRSPHVVQVFDYGVWQGIPYIAMELLEGEDLDARLARAGRLGLGEAAAIVAQIALALERAHAAGLVHRDLKPANVFLVPEGGRELVKILDFGIAKRVSDFDGGVTKDGAFLGTPCYMSPEQTRNSRSVDYRSDLWSLGVIAFESVTGRRPFDGDSLGELLQGIASGPLPVPSHYAPSLPAAFDEWWARAAVREPGARFPSARAMADALAQVAVSCPAAPPAANAVSAAPPPLRATLATHAASGGAMTASADRGAAPAAALRRARARLGAALFVGLAALAVAVAAQLTRRSPPVGEAVPSAAEVAARSGLPPARLPETGARAAAPPSDLGPSEAAAAPATPVSGDGAPGPDGAASAAPKASSAPGGGATRARLRPPARPPAGPKPSQYDDGI